MSVSIVYLLQGHAFVPDYHGVWASGLRTLLPAHEATEWRQGLCGVSPASGEGCDSGRYPPHLRRRWSPDRLHQAHVALYLRCK